MSRALLYCVRHIAGWYSCTIGLGRTVVCSIIIGGVIVVPEVVYLRGTREACFVISVHEAAGVSRSF